MKRSVAAIAVAGVVALGGAALAGPALAESAAPSATSPSSPAPSSTSTSGAAGADRPAPRERITGALAGLVTDGTITQAQADAVATTLAEELPRGGHDGDHDGFGRAAFGQIAAAASQALGVSEADLRTGLRSGRSVADVAQERGVDIDVVTEAVTDAARTQVDAAVADGRITRERADALTAGLDAKIAEELSESHDDDDHDGPGRRGAPFADPGAGPVAPTS